MPSNHHLGRKLVFIAVFLWLCITTAWAQKIPHSLTAEGTGNIASVELIKATQRYAHFVLGDRFEASGFQVTFKDGQQIQFALPPSEVFEDRVPRLVDLNGDGQQELVLVQSHVDKGASLAVYDLTPGSIELLAQTPYIGQPNRWLNPAGIADFDGDGQIEIALVAKPHLAKELQLWRFAKGQLSLISTHQGFSNHRLGSREQRLSVVFDDNGDGIADLALPNASRNAIHIVSFVLQFDVLRTYLLADELAGPLTKTGDTLVAPLRNGSSMRLQLVAD